MNRDATDDVVVFTKHQLTPPHDIDHRNMYVAIYDTCNHDSHCSWRNPVALWAQDPQTYHGEHVHRFSEDPPEEYGDTRARTFGLGDVDNDGYLDNVVFPSIPRPTGATTSDAIVRFQLGVGHGPSWPEMHGGPAPAGSACTEQTCRELADRVCVRAS